MTAVSNGHRMEAKSRPSQRGGHRNCPGMDSTYTTIKSLPKGLEVVGDIMLEYSSLNELTTYKLRKMIQPGFIKGKIKRG